jgi:hypothetical protein
MTEPSALPSGPFPGSIAIAGAWGYIGRKFLDVTLARGLRTYVFDPGPAPVDVDLSRLTLVGDEAAFHRLDADLYHLAVHPEHRRTDLLLARDEPLLILNEKPMAEPHRPETCRRVVEATDASRAVMLYDFPELFDPLTERIFAYLKQFRDVRLTGVFLQRSKDREDPRNPRNEKRMVPIQYQESVHCLAFVLYVLAALEGGLQRCLDGGVTVEGESEPYRPPNPEVYPYVVDCRCRYSMTLGGVRVDGLTDFKRGAEWAKRRVIRGVGDGEPFEIDVSYLEGGKHLRVNGEDLPCDPNASSYEHVLATAFRWFGEVDRTRLMSGLYPNPRFTRVTYQLSSALWRSCRDRRAVAFGSASDLDAWDAGFAAELPRLGRYGPGA